MRSAYDRRKLGSLNVCSRACRAWASEFKWGVRVRDQTELREFLSRAVLHWTPEIRSKMAAVSTLPILLDTQDKFIAVLKLAAKTPTAWSSILEEAEGLNGPIFLKHLMVLSDMGGEALNKIVPISKYFPDGIMKFIWRNNECEYKFKCLHEARSATNSSLKVCEKHIVDYSLRLTDLSFDVAMLLMFGSSATNGSLPEEVSEKCLIGSLIGQPAQLEEFCKQNYIRVSRQVQGAAANKLGALVQSHVRDELRKFLPDWSIERDQSLPQVTHKEGGNGTNFDVRAVAPNGIYFGIEVSFQVTTNSTIERKAREAANVYSAAHAHNHRVCYVIDGAGNINVRRQAVQTIYAYSDCTVTFHPDELQRLADYMRNEALRSSN